MANEKILGVKDLSVSFGDFNVFHSISFEIGKGEALAIVGPNGSGKSVLFRALLGLIPYSGEVSWGRNINPVKSSKVGVAKQQFDRVKISYVPQKLAIENQLPVSVKDFFNFKTKSKKKIMEALNAVGIVGDDAHLRHHVLNKKLGVLSGGQFQRVMIAWAIINKPDILLFDEPTSGVDVGGEETIYNLLHKLQTKNHLAIILISHDLNIVYHYADKVMCLNKEMVCFGEPHEVLNTNSLKKLYGKEAKFYHHEH